MGPASTSSKTVRFCKMCELISLGTGIPLLILIKLLKADVWGISSKNVSQSIEGLCRSVRTYSLHSVDECASAEERAARFRRKEQRKKTICSFPTVFDETTSPSRAGCKL